MVERLLKWPNYFGQFFVFLISLSKIAVYNLRNEFQSMSNPSDIILKNVKILSQSTVNEYEFVHGDEYSLPNIDHLKEIVKLLKSVIFPGYFSNSGIYPNLQSQHIGINLERLHILLREEVNNVIKFFSNLLDKGMDKTAEELSITFIDRIPEIKRLLYTDVKAVFDGDPAAKSYGEVILCYPAIQAMTNFRIAHELLQIGIPVIPRIITEIAHSDTGIDIHPGAQIGEYFSIDHGTGVVIGETCIIGNHVQLYQGVTLGARSFTYDERGLPVNIPRHPILEDNLIVYSNATILGRITIGHDSIIGGNIWQTSSVPPHSRILQRKAVSSFTGGLGI